MLPAFWSSEALASRGFGTPQPWNDVSRAGVFGKQSAADTA
jgi:hypothetical protein